MPRRLARLPVITRLLALQDGEAGGRLGIGRRQWHVGQIEEHVAVRLDNMVPRDLEALLTRVVHVFDGDYRIVDADIGRGSRRAGVAFEWRFMRDLALEKV